MHTFFKTTIPGFLICLLFLAGCRPGTEITGTWTNPEAQQLNYNNVLVFAMTDRIHIKQTVETAMVEELRAQGINAISSTEELPPRLQDGPIEDKGTLMEIIEQHRHDAVLTIAVVDERTETRYVPGAGMGPGGWAPMGRFGYYGNFWGYYSHWHPQMYQPGYYQEDRVYFIETNLYDVSTENLVWSAQSETVNPRQLERFSNNLAEVTVEELTQRNFFSPEEVIAGREEELD